jgi:hypothetical protein
VRKTVTLPSKGSAMSVDTAVFVNSDLHEMLGVTSAF